MSCAEKIAHTWRKREREWREETHPACSTTNEANEIKSGGDGNDSSNGNGSSEPGDLADVSIMLIKADNARECSICRHELSTASRIPNLWWTKYCRNSNGCFGYKEIADKDGSVGEVVTWARFLVKLLQDEGRYEWLKFNVIIYWNLSSHQTNVLLFDLPAVLRDPVLNSLKQAALNQDARSDPFWPYPSLVEQLVSSQDEAVWFLRTLVRNIEKRREISSNPSNQLFPRMHDLARHALHISETLDVGDNTLASLIARHHEFMANNPSFSAAPSGIHHRLLFFQNFLQNLRRRSDSSHQRLQNEIQLAFNIVSQRDAGISLVIGRATQADSAAVKTIAMLTMAFLPATFVAAIFSMSFFGVNDDGEWVMSGKFWMYWVFAIPISVATTALWFHWQRGKSGASSSANDDKLEDL